MLHIKLEWPARPAAELVTTYRVLESQDGGAFTVKANVTTNSITFQPAAVGYAWKVQAGNFRGYGDESDPVEGPGLPGKVGDITVSIVEVPE